MDMEIDNLFQIQNPTFQPKALAILAIQKIRRSNERGFDEKLLRDETFMHMMKYFLRCSGNPSLQMEACWIFTNIAAGPSEHTAFLIDNGIVPLTFQLFSSPNDEVVEQALWTIGNIIGDNVKYREMIISMGGLERVLSFVREGTSVSFQRTLIWVIVNFVRFKDEQLSLEVVEKIVPKLFESLQRTDTTVLVDTLWALTYISDCGNDYIQAIVDHENIIPLVVVMLSNHRFKIQMSAIRFLGNIATGTDDQTYALIDGGILEHIQFLLIHIKENIRRLALWCLSNISIGTLEQAQAILNSGLLRRIVQNLNRHDVRTQKEAMLTVHNLIFACSKEQSMDFIEAGAIIPMYTLMMSHDTQVANAARNSLKNLFKKADLLVDKYAQIYETINHS